jgi:cytochrome b561
MASWLRFHIVTGLVGPYMVLLHTTMRFSGLAGLAMLLTVVVVVSGAVGRYLYTATPRTVDGAGPEASAPDAHAGRLAARRGAIATWYSFHVPLTWVLFAAAFVHVAAALFYATLQR